MTWDCGRSFKIRKALYPAIDCFGPDNGQGSSYRCCVSIGHPLPSPLYHSGKLNGLAGYSIVYGLLILIQVLNTWLLIKIAGKIEVWLVYDIRKAGFKRLQELSFSYYDSSP